MEFWIFMAAGLLSAIWLAVHLIAGGRDVAQPLLESADLDPILRETLYLCWHLISITIACIAGLFLWAAMTGTAALAAVGAVLASGFAVLGVGLVVLRKNKHLDLPQGWLFVPVAVLGFAGLLL